MNVEQMSYGTKITVKSNSNAVFNALTTTISEWWGDQDKPVSKVGDVFTVSWAEPWYQFKIVEYIPNERVVWECTDAHQIIGELQGVEKEWVGTRLEWTIKTISENETELSFTHMGLVPEFICYDFCANTWDRFITYNLKKYLER